MYTVVAKVLCVATYNMYACLYNNMCKKTLIDLSSRLLFDYINLRMCACIIHNYDV